MIMLMQAELVGKELQVIFDPLRASRQWRELQGYDTSTSKLQPRRVHCLTPLALCASLVRVLDRWSVSREEQADLRCMTRGL